MKRRLCSHNTVNCDCHIPFVIRFLMQIVFVIIHISLLIPVLLVMAINENIVKRRQKRTAMANIKMEFVEQLTDNTFKYKVTVNGKMQGHVVHHNYSEKNSFYRIEDDKKNYDSKDEVIRAVCEKNGRKLKD